MKRIAINATIIAAVLLSCFILVYFEKVTDKDETQLTVACGDDIAGMLVSAVLDDSNGQPVSLDTDYISLGDCCGSHAQFALSTGEVDVAVLCPDAVAALNDSGKAYSVLGAVVYDSDVLVRRKEESGTPSSIGYMNKRTEQLDLLRERFPSGTRFCPMFPSALAYALENGAVDAIVLDISSAVKLGLPTEPLSSGRATYVMVADSELIGDKRLDDFIEAYNAAVECTADDDYISALLSSDDAPEDIEEILLKWNLANVRFGFLTAETE